MQRVKGRVIKVGWALTVMMAASMVAAGCGLVPSDTLAKRSASPTASASSSPSASKQETPGPSGPARGSRRYAPPASACDVVTSEDKARLGMTKVKEDDAALQVSCALSNSPKGSRFRNLRITYNTAPAAASDATAYAKSYFIQRKTSDFQHPNAFAGRPTVAGSIEQTGTSKAGRDFDDGYYVFYLTDTAGAKEGNGLAVIRKGDVVIAITASGTDIPGRRVVDGRPIKNETTQRMIDTIADHVVRAVKQKSGS